jgi:hypothetical protein
MKFSELITSAAPLLILTGGGKTTRQGAGHYNALRPTPRSPSEELRPWSAGDDLRHMDWRVFARSRKMNIRTAREEARNLHSFFLDTSASMRYSTPAWTSCLQAVTLLAYRSLRHHNQTWCQGHALDVTGLEQLHTDWSALPSGRELLPPSTAAGHPFPDLENLPRYSRLTCVTDLHWPLDRLEQLCRQAGQQSIELSVIYTRPSLDLPERQMHWQDLETGKLLGRRMSAGRLREALEAGFERRVKLIGTAGPAFCLDDKGAVVSQLARFLEYGL